MSRSLWLLAGIMLAGAAGPARAESEDAYRSRLEAAVREVGAAESGSPSEARRRLLRAASRLGETVTIEPASGSPYSIDHTDLRNDLRSAAPGGRLDRVEVRRARQRLEMRLDAARAPARNGGSLATNRDAEQRTLAAVLARREFQTSPVDEVWRWVAERVIRFLTWLLGRRPAGLLPWVAWAVMIGALTVLALGLAWVLYLFLAHRTSGARGVRPGGPVEQIERRPTPEGYLARAEQAARQEDYRAAVRDTYLAILLFLDRGGLVPFDPARTNGEVLAQLRDPDREPTRSLLAPVTLAVDQRLYGGVPATPDDYQHCRLACTRLETLVCGG